MSRAALDCTCTFCVICFIMAVRLAVFKPGGTCSISYSNIYKFKFIQTYFVTEKGRVLSKTARSFNVTSTMQVDHRQLFLDVLEMFHRTQSGSGVVYVLSGRFFQRKQITQVDCFRNIPFLKVIGDWSGNLKLRTMRGKEGAIILIVPPDVASNKNDLIFFYY